MAATSHHILDNAGKIQQSPSQAVPDKLLRGMLLDG